MKVSHSKHGHSSNSFYSRKNSLLYYFQHNYFYKASEWLSEKLWIDQEDGQTSIAFPYAFLSHILSFTKYWNFSTIF